MTNHETRTNMADHPEKVRMLVLETDEAHPDTESERGSFGDIFDQLFKQAGDKHDPPLGVETVIRFIVENEGGKVPTLDDFKRGEFEDIHAILITGSMYDAHGGDEWILKLVKLIQGWHWVHRSQAGRHISNPCLDLWTERPEMRFSGVCFGHQVLCRALGSKIEPTPGEKWELAHTEIKLSPVGEKLFKKSGSIHLHQMHQDHVVNGPSPSTTDLLPEDTPAHVWGSSETTKIQGVYLPKRLFTSQGHLGFDEKMVKRQIEMRVESGGIKDMDQAEAAKKTADMEHDGESVASAILRFFDGDDAL